VKKLKEIIGNRNPQTGNRKTDINTDYSEIYGIHRLWGSKIKSEMTLYK
jgi:hypothetical protein